MAPSSRTFDRPSPSGPPRRSAGVRARSALERALAALLLVAALGCGSDAADPADTASGADGGAVDGALSDSGGSADAQASDSGSAGDAGGAGDAATTDSAAADATSGDGGALDTLPQDAGPADPCKPAGGGLKKTVIVPLGETLFFDGDDYLAFWGVDRPCAVQLTDKPTDAQASVVGNGKRLTPDKAGKWRLESGSDVITLDVQADYWTADTFQNFNYSPTQPIALEPADVTETMAWVATPTSSAVQQVFLSDAGAKKGKLVPTGGWPSAVAVWPGTDWLLVTQTARDTLGFLNRKTGVLVDAVRVGNEPANVVVDPTSGTPPTLAYVALSGEDRVAKIDLTSRTVIATVDVGRDPRAMALDSASGTLYVASLISSNQHPRGPMQVKDKKTGETHPVPEFMQRDVAAVDVDTWKVSGWAREVGTILRGVYLQPAQAKTVGGGSSDDPVAARLLVAASVARNKKLQVDANKRPHEHHLVALDPQKFSLAAPDKAQSAVTVDVDLDKQASSSGSAASPYTMRSSPDGHYLVVSLSASQGLLFLDAKTLAERGRMATGHDPRGLIFAHGRAWTYAWLSDTLEGLPLPGAPTQVMVAGGGLGGGAKPGSGQVAVWKMGPAAPDAPKPAKLTVGNDPTPKDVRAGQRVFNDASFSKFADFSCNNCHVDGLSDGLTWDLLVDGPVNTLAFRNVGGTDPFLWGGQLPTLFDFSREVLKLVGAEASGKQMEQLTTYMMSVTAPPNPFALPGGKLTPDAKAGKVVFAKLTDDGGANCAGCHGGPLGTTGITVKGKTPNKDTDVPSLLGVYDTAPFGRQGQWATLQSMVDYALEFTGAKLSETARKQVTAYVRQLPGDLLTLNSAIPANNAKHVWKESPVELAFSHVLAPGQEGLFSFLEGKGAAAKPLPGTWTVSGRYARFAPAAPLKGDTAYQMVVQKGLEGAFGQTLPAPLYLAFETGGVPAFDVSGKWKLTLSNSLVGTIKINVALIMAQGGKLTGVVLDSFDEGNVGADAIGGVVSGKVLSLDPFYIDSQFGQFFVKDGIDSTMSDSDSDGFADLGTGGFDFKFGNTVYKVGVKWKRTALPKP